MPMPELKTEKPEATLVDIIFGHAFRPFFLLVGAYAMLMLLAWAFYLSGVIVWPDGLPPRVRHGHEMSNYRISVCGPGYSWFWE